MGPHCISISCQVLNCIFVCKYCFEKCLVPFVVSFLICNRKHVKIYPSHKLPHGLFLHSIQYIGYRLQTLCNHLQLDLHRDIYQTINTKTMYEMQTYLACVHIPLRKSMTDIVPAVLATIKVLKEKK